MKKLYAYFCKIELSIAMFALCVSTLLIFFSAVARSVGNPVNAALEISLFIFAWCIFLSADVALRDDRMMSMDIFINLMPKKIQTYCMIVSYCIIFVFLCVLIGFGFYLSWKTRIRSFPGIQGLSYTWITLSLPVASSFMMVTCVLKIREFIRRLGFPEPRDGEPGEKAASAMQASESLNRAG
ncbi:MAG: TRAP transporter small permease subunit [Desulfovibrio sp.]|jgi:TRAP-type C4-dicarboxylate transport system permease small subunit|nr:TRAP transporter small permease subunit [Desulfovibrio sp.]